MVLFNSPFVFERPFEMRKAETRFPLIDPILHEKAPHCFLQSKNLLKINEQRIEVRGLIFSCLMNGEIVV